jgi:hypothetical protein
MRKILLTAGAALIALSGSALAQGHGGGGGPGGAGGGGGPPVGVPGGGPGGGEPGGGLDLPGGASTNLPGPPTTIPPSDHANSNATGQNRGQSGDEVNAQTDSHASARAHERTGADVDHSGTAVSGAGLATKTYRVGQHVSANAKFYTDLNAIPDTAKSQIPSQYMGSTFRYIYQPDRIYVVDSTSNKVVSVVNLMP